MSKLPNICYTFASYYTRKTTLTKDREYLTLWTYLFDVIIKYKYGFAIKYDFHAVFAEKYISQVFTQKIHLAYTSWHHCLSVNNLLRPILQCLAQIAQLVHYAAKMHPTRSLY